MPKQVFLESRNQTLEFPDDATQEEINQSIATEFPRNGEDVAFDMSKYQSVSDIRDFISQIPNDDYIMLNNYRADKKLSWGELAGIAGDAIGTIVGDVVKGAGAAVTKAGDGVAESALRGVAAGTVDLVNLGQKLITPNERIPTFEEFMQTPRNQLGYAYGPAPTVTQVQPTEQDYNNLIDQQRQMELQALDIADVSEKLIQGAPVPEVAKGASYLDAVTLAGLAKSVARSGVKSIYKAVTKQPLTAAAEVVPDVAAKGTPILDVVSGELKGADIPANMMAKSPFVANAEQFAAKVGEGARKAGLTGVQLGAGTVKGAADLGKGVINLAERLGLENAALRGSIGGAIGYKEGGVEGAIMGTVLGSVVPKAIKGTVSGISRTADFIGAAAKVAKSGPSRTGIFEKMAQAANISPEARKIAEKVLFTQPFVQYASEATKQAAKNAILGVPVGAALGYAADGEEGAAAGAGAGFAIGGMVGPLDASFDAIKSIAGRSTARSQRNAAGDINSFVNDIADDQARSDYGEIMNRAIQIAGPERAADMLDSLRLAEGMGANVKVVPASERKNAFNSFSYNDTNGGTITINPDRMNAGSIQHEVFHQLFNVGIRGELQKALSDVYLPKKDADGNIIQNGLFDDKEFAKKAAELAKKYIGNEKGYKDALEFASTLDNPAGFSPEAVDKAREFVIDEMTASYTEKFMGRSRTGVFNPDRLPMWHRQILENIDDKILNRINDKIFADKSVKDPTAFFTDAEGKPVRVPQLDPVLKRAFSRNLNRDRNTVGKPREVIAPKNPRELASWAAATFGATRDVLDPTGQRPLTEQERKVITAADFDAAKDLYQSLPDDAKQTVRVTKKSGVPTDINSKGARIEITSQTPSNVFESFLQVAKDRGMGNQQLANMRQLYASMAMDDGPTFDTVNNPVYKYNPKTGKMTPGVRPASKQEIYPTAITVNSAGGFNVEYIDLSRVKANAEKILDNPKYKGVWNGIDDFMTDFGSSLRNLSKGEAAAMPSAELLGKGNEKVGAMKRDLIAEAMNVTLPKRLQGEGKGYINQPTIDPLTLATKEGKDRRTEGSAFRDFRVERLTNVTPTNNRLKMVKEDAYDIFVQRFQPSAFTPESLPNGESFTNPDGYRILNKAGSKLFRTYDDTGKLIGIAESKEKAMKKAQDEFAKKAMKEEPANIRFQFAGEAAEMPKFMRDSLETAKAMAKEGKDSETIRAITGWFPGKYDDKMRWEVPDQMSVLKGTVKADELVSRAWKSVTQPRQPDAPTAQLQDILRHPALFSAYPEAAAIPIVADVNLSSSGAIGPMSGFEGNVIQVNGNLSGDRLKSTLLHEVQHWIQDKEGFARGGNVSTADLSQIEAEIVSKAISDAQKTKSEPLYQDESLEWILKNDPSLTSSQKQWAVNVVKAGPSAIKELQANTPVGRYRRTAGEIESRDVQARQSFTPEQRKAIAPYSSENIAKEEAIVLKSASKSPTEMRFQPMPKPGDKVNGLTLYSVDKTSMKNEAWVVTEDGSAFLYRSNSPTFKLTRGRSNAIPNQRPELEVLRRDFQAEAEARPLPVQKNREPSQSDFTYKTPEIKGVRAEDLKVGDWVEGNGGQPIQIQSITPRSGGLWLDFGNGNASSAGYTSRFNRAKKPDIRFQPDPASPNILNGSNGSRIIKSTSGKYRVYLATGALAGVKDTLESAQKLVQSKSKSYAPN